MRRNTTLRLFAGISLITGAVNPRVARWRSTLRDLVGPRRVAIAKALVEGLIAWWRFEPFAFVWTVEIEWRSRTEYCRHPFDPRQCARPIGRSHPHHGLLGPDRRLLARSALCAHRHQRRSVPGQHEWRFRCRLHFWRTGADARARERGRVYARRRHGAELRACRRQARKGALFANRAIDRETTLVGVHSHVRRFK